MRKDFSNGLKRIIKNLILCILLGILWIIQIFIESIQFMQETNSPGGKFLQFDGMKKRTSEELSLLFEQLKDAGIELIDFTFYGTKEYHDRFAGRQGDFELMINSMNCALQKGLGVDVGIPVTKENIGQIDELLQLLPEKDIKIYLFTPHCGGRGITLLDSKITIEDFERLSNEAKSHFHRELNKTPFEWFNQPLEEVKFRSLIISLNPSNIETLEKQSFDETLQMLEKMDDYYHRQIPSFKELLHLYVDFSDTHLYTKKDLYALYRRKYIEDNSLDIYDIYDERQTGSIRY